MTPIRLMICGKMGSGKSSAAEYLESTYGAVRWTRSEMMKRLAHALVDQVGDLEGLLSAVLPDPSARTLVREQLLRYAAEYEPELGKPRRLYQDVTEIVIRQDPLAFERELMRRIQMAENSGVDFSLVDDIRSEYSFNYFSEHGYQSLRIQALPKICRERMLKRDGYLPDAATFDHPSETALDAVSCDFVIDNNSGNPRQLQEDLDRLVKSLRGNDGNEGDAGGDDA